MAFTFKQEQGIDEVLDGFVTLKTKLLSLMVKKKEQQVAKEQDVIVLQSEIDTLQDDQIRAARIIGKIDDLIN